MKKLLILVSIFLAFNASAQHHWGGWGNRGGGWGNRGGGWGNRGGGWGGSRGYYHPVFRSYVNTGCYARPYYYGYAPHYWGPWHPYYRPYFGIGFGVGLPFVPPLIAPVLSLNYTSVSSPAYASTEPVYNTPAPNAVPPVNVSSSSMSATDFERAKSSIYAKGSDNSKLTIAEEVVDGNYVNSSQVREIMGLLNTENARLDFAKYAYARTVDTNNYYIVNDALSTEASVSELNSFINKR